MPLNRVTAMRRLAYGSLARGSRLPIVVALRASLSGGSRGSRQGLRAPAPRQIQGAELRTARSAPEDPVVEAQPARPALRSRAACVPLRAGLRFTPARPLLRCGPASKKRSGCALA